MNKKNLLIFIAGFMLGGVVVGASYSLMKSKPLSASTFPMESVVVPPLANPMLFEQMMSPEEDMHSVSHTIVKGDTLTGIAKKYGTTTDLIQKVNRVTATKLAIGRKIKIPNYIFSVVVDKSKNILMLKGGEEVLKTYVVSTGKNNSTPVGTFKITDKLIDPTWYTAGAVMPPGSPENGLCTRWMGFTKKNYGIHGTIEPDKLGQQVTAGCVRMRNEEVEELFSVLPSGTEVTIVD